MNFDHIQKNKPFIWWVRVARFRQNMVKSRNWTGDMHQHVPGVNGHGMETKMDRQREPLWPYTQTMFLQFFSIWNPKDTNARPIPDNYRSGWKCAQLIYIYTYYTLTIIARPFCLPTSFPPGMSHSLLAEVMRPIHAPANCAFGLIKCLAFDGRIWWKYDGNLMAESDGNDTGLSNNITMF